MTKSCGGCTECCYAISVVELKKPYFTWCSHAEKGKGCTIYADRPESCLDWSCRWLITEMPDNLRPDRCHVVFAPRPLGRQFSVWCHPKYPDAFRRKPAESIIRTIGKKGFVPLVWRGKEAIIVLTGTAAGSIGLDPAGWYEKTLSVNDTHWTPSREPQSIGGIGDKSGFCEITHLRRQK